MSTASIENNPLIGIWKLISATAIHADGTVTPDVYGTHPVGHLHYTSDGHMMVMFCKSDRPFNPSSTPLINLFVDSIGYLTIDPNELPRRTGGRGFTRFRRTIGFLSLRLPKLLHRSSILSFTSL